MMTMSTEASNPMTREQFNEAVVDELEARGRDDVAADQQRYIGNAHALDPYAVAGEIDVEPTTDAVDEIADAAIDYYEDVVAPQQEDDEGNGGDA